MAIEVQDGTGSSRKAKVDEDNRLEVKAITIKDVEDAAERGDVYFCPTNRVFTINTSAEQSLAFLRNDSTTREVHVDEVTFDTNQTDSIFRLYKNVTTVSAATTVTPVNSNFESGKAAEALFTAFTTAATSFTGGTLMRSVQPVAGRICFETFDAIILGKDDNLMLSIFSPTSALCGADIIFHHED